MNENIYSKEDSICTKGICILIILIHHIFWNEFSGVSDVQVFILPQITRFFTSYGFCLNHIFFAITGGGIALGLNKLSPISLLIHREENLFKLFIPIFILSILLYLLFMKCSPISFLRNVYNEKYGKHLFIFL